MHFWNVVVKNVAILCYTARTNMLHESNYTIRHCGTRLVNFARLLGTVNRSARETTVAVITPDPSDANAKTRADSVFGGRSGLTAGARERTPPAGRISPARSRYVLYIFVFFFRRWTTSYDNIENNIRTRENGDFCDSVHVQLDTPKEKQKPPPRRVCFDLCRNADETRQYSTNGYGPDWYDILCVLFFRLARRGKIPGRPGSRLILSLQLVNSWVR